MRSWCVVLLVRVSGKLAEYDGAGVVEQDAVLAVPLHRAGERLGLGVPAHGHQRVRVQGVVHPEDLLLDDGTFIEVRA